MRSQRIKILLSILALAMLGYSSWANPSSALSPQAPPEFIFPIEGYSAITSRFGARKDPFTGDDDFHNGIDIAAAEGTPVYAAADGIVIRSEEAGGYGLLIVIRHGSHTASWYAHNSELKVNAGDRVRQGDLIALIGQSGYATGPHCHFEIAIDGEKVNPLLYMEEPVRD